MTTRTLAYCALGALVSVAAACGGGTGPQGATPTISSVTPATGTVGTELTITGTNFRTGVEVKLDTLTATGVQLNGDTVYASVPAGVAADTVYTVTVLNTDGTQAMLAGAFTPVAPVLQFVNSATKPSGNTGSTVIIEGDAFGDVQGTGQVLFSNGSGGTIAATIATPGDWTNTFIVTTVPSSAATGPIAVMTETGTSDSLTFTITQNATFSPSAITWKTTQNLPVAVSGHHALYVPIDDASGQTIQYVFVTGGAGNDSVPLADVNVATIQNNGTLSGWTKLTALPAARAFHRSLAATPFNSKVQGSGYLYVLGGIETKNGDPVTTIYRATLANDGTIGSWTNIGDLPQALHSFGVALFRSTIYVAGGATTGNAPVADVYSARIDTLGNLSTWRTENSLPSARAYLGFDTFGGYLYTVGGETGTVDPNDAGFTNNNTKLSEVDYSKVDLRTDTLGAWTPNGNPMTKARTKQSSLVAGGALFESAGLYAAAGTGSSENIYATINSNGTVGSFNGATGSNTLFSVGGVDLFNHAAVVYQDASGVSHVMILGGDDVNSPGTKQAKVLYY